MLFSELVKEVREWSHANFGDQPAYRPLAGVLEEIGEMMHACLKGSQGIRSQEDWEERVRDGMADAAIFLADWVGRAYPERSFREEWLTKRRELLDPRCTPPGARLEKSWSYFPWTILVECWSRLWVEAITHTFRLESLEQLLVEILVRFEIIYAGNPSPAFASFSSYVSAIWLNEVKPRNWKQFPKNGRTE